MMREAAGDRGRGARADPGAGLPRLMWPRRRGWCARGCRIRPGRGGGGPGCGRWMPPRTRSWSWASTWPARGSRRSPWNRRRDYWRIWFYLLEAAGLDVQLVNARESRTCPGRPKTDKLDSGLAGEADRAGHAAALVRPAGGDPAAAGLHPAAHRPDPGADPALAAAGEAAGGRADQGLGGGQHAWTRCRSGTCSRR